MAPFICSNEDDGQGPSTAAAALYYGLPTDEVSAGGVRDGSGKPGACSEVEGEDLQRTARPEGARQNLYEKNAAIEASAAVIGSLAEWMSADAEVG